MSSTTIDHLGHFNNCQNKNENIDSSISHENTQELFNVQSIFIKEEPIHLTEEDFKESLRNTWLPDVDSKGENDPLEIKQESSKKHILKPESECKMCQKKFKDEQCLKDHIEICVKMKNHGFLCSVCNKVFTTRSRLQNHSRIHTGVKPYACSICHKAFADRSAFVKHERIHFRQKDDRLECHLCGNLFSDSWGLKKHHLTHSGEKPYKCPICNKAFRTSSTLVVHKRMHTGERPYSCTQCDKSFAVKTHLVTHSRTHSGERPYECSVCGRAFSDRSSWRRHARRHDHEHLANNSIPQPNTLINNYQPKVTGNKKTNENNQQTYNNYQQKINANNRTNENQQSFNNVYKDMHPVPTFSLEHFHKFILDHQPIEYKHPTKVSEIPIYDKCYGKFTSKNGVEISPLNPFVKNTQKNTETFQYEPVEITAVIDNKSSDKTEDNLKYLSNYQFTKSGDIENVNLQYADEKSAFFLQSSEQKSSGSIEKHNLNQFQTHNGELNHHFIQQVEKNSQPVKSQNKNEIFTQNQYLDNSTASDSKSVLGTLSAKYFQH